MGKVLSIKHGEQPIRGEVAEGAKILEFLPHNFLDGKKGVSHGYLTLCDHNGEIIQQIHGLAYSLAENKLAVNGARIPKYGPKLLWEEVCAFLSPEPQAGDNAEIDSARMQLAVMIGGHDDPMLHCLRRNESHSQVLYQADEEDVMMRWKKALLAAREINLRGHQYRSQTMLRGSITCHTVVETLADVMEIDTSIIAKDSPYIRRGAHTSILDTSGYYGDIGVVADKNQADLEMFLGQIDLSHINGSHSVVYPNVNGLALQPETNEDIAPFLYAFTHAAGEENLCHPAVNMASDQNVVVGYYGDIGLQEYPQAAATMKHDFLSSVTLDQLADFAMEIYQPAREEAHTRFREKLRRSAAKKAAEVKEVPAPEVNTPAIESYLPSLPHIGEASRYASAALAMAITPVVSVTISPGFEPVNDGTDMAANYAWNTEPDGEQAGLRV